MNKERLLELAGVPLTEAKKCKCGCDPKTCGCKADCKCGCNAVTEMHHEEAEEGSIFSTMTREEFKGIGASLGLAWDRAVGDLKSSGSERPKEEAFDLVSRQVDDALRKLEQEAKDD